MSSASPDNSTSNHLLTDNSSDTAQNALNSSQNHTADFDLSNEIPMNLLPAGNSEIFIQKILFESRDFFRNNY